MHSYKSSSSVFVRVFYILIRCIQTIIFPPFCAYCGIYKYDRVPLCTSCLLRIIPIASTRVSLTASRAIIVHAIFNYQDPLRSLVLAKSSGRIAVARQLGELLWQMTPLIHIDFDYIVPVPLHWKRYAYRGYNQAHEMARVIAAYSGKPIIRPVARVRHTLFQSAIDFNKRFDNVKEVFLLKKKYLQEQYYGKRILIVDDLMTSGATLHALGRELLILKPASLHAIIVCRTI